MRHATCLVKTLDWWHSNYYEDGNTSKRKSTHDVRDINIEDISTWNGREYVRLQLFIAHSSNPNNAFVALNVAGSGDSAMYKNFKLEEYPLAKQLFDELKASQPITIAQLKAKEFHWF